MLRFFSARITRISLAAVLLLLPAACNRAARKAQDEPPKLSETQPAAPNSPVDDGWPVAEEFDFDWQGNGQPAHFKMERGPGEQQPSRLTINIKGQQDFVLNSEDVWVEYASDFGAKEDFPHHVKNLSPSKYVLILPISTQKRLRPLVFLLSPAYAGEPERLQVLAMSATGHPREIFNDNFHLSEVRDLNGDGLPEMAGLPCFSKEYGNHLLTYDPYQVYQLTTVVTPEWKLSLPLTREYNLKHYYGWAGPNCSDEYAVVLHPPNGGKTVVMKSDEAEELVENK